MKPASQARPSSARAIRPAIAPERNRWTLRFLLIAPRLRKADAMRTSSAANHGRSDGCPGVRRPRYRPCGHFVHDLCRRVRIRRGYRALDSRIGAAAGCPAILLAAPIPEAEPLILVEHRH